MGCDIHAYAERKTEQGWELVPIRDLFQPRYYSVFAFLAGARNYSAIDPIAQPRGTPKDVSDAVRKEIEDWGCDGHSHSWLSVAELSAIDYDKTVEDRRCTKQIAPRIFDGGSTCDPGDGKVLTLRDFLGRSFFESLDALVISGAERVVFWFDN